MNRSTLAKATSAEDAPTPGYLYGEVAKMTFEGADVTQKVCRYLVDRLKRKEPVVKHKVLLIIKHVCRRGDGSFRRTIQAAPNIGEVKACLQFTGPADPLKGDQPYRAVREAAKDALEAIFDNSTEITSSNSALARRIQGYGASAGPASSGPAASDASSHYDVNARSSGVPAARYASGPSGGGGGGGGGYGGMVNMTSSGPQYQGIGNPNFTDPRNQPKGFMDRVKDRIEEYSDKASKSAASAGIQQWLGSEKRHGTPPRHDSGSYAGPGVGSYAGPSAGGGSYGGPGQSSSMGASAHQGPWGGPSMATGDPRSPRLTSTSDVSSAPVSDGRYERSLVDGLCARGGVRPVPSREKMNAFLAACKTLDAQVVMPIIYEKLSSAEWKVQHKALCVCEALVQAEDLEAFVDYLDEHAEILEDLRQSSQPTVRNRTQAVWALLYGGDETAEAPAAGSAPSSAPTHAPAQTFHGDVEEDLLNFGSTSPVAAAPSGIEAAPPAPAPAPASAQPVPASNGDGGLFGSLQVKSSGGGAAPSSSTAAEDGGDLLLYGEPDQHEDSAAPAQTAQNGAGSGSTDLEALLDGASTAPSGPSKAEDLASRLEALSVTSATSNGGSEVSQPGSNTGFSFISGGGANSNNINSSSGVGSGTGGPGGFGTGGPLQPKSAVSEKSPFDDLMGSAQQAQSPSPGPGTMPGMGMNGGMMMMGQPGQSGGTMTPQQMQALQFQQFQQLMQMQQQVGMAPSPQQQQQLMQMLQQTQLQMQQQGMVHPQQMQNLQQAMPNGGGSMAPLNGGTSLPKVSRSVSASSTSSQQSKAQPDKFDFVSSTMAQMK